MYYIKDIRTEKELFWVSHESWAKKFMYEHNLRLMTTTRDDKGNTILWVTTK